MRGAVVLLFSALYAVGAFSQQVVVRDADSKAALNKAEVSSVSGIVLYTDRNGVFELDTFLNEPQIFVSHNGYATRGIYVSDISRKDPTISLKRKALDLGTAYVTPKGESTLTEPTQQIEVVESREILFGNPMTSASVLENTGLVAVQRSQLGGGSPVMRGFEANKVLLIVDGVRMNNAIYRSGHVQNAITVDANILERTEVFFGPASVLYGSDALGGAIHFKTKKPALAEEFNKNLTRVNIIGKVASASQESSIHADVMFGSKKIGFLTSITKSEFGDLKMGDNRSHGYDNWGLVPFYAAREEGTDVLRVNENQRIQKYTGYEQVDFLQKFTYKLGKYASLNANFQYSNSTDIPRFDRLNDVSDDGLKWAEWYYGPQRRFLSSVNLNLTGRKLFSEANFTLAHQRIDEDRVKRRFGSDQRFTNEEDVNVVSLNADFIRDRNNDRIWFYGAEITTNDVTSTAFETNISTGAKTEAITRYPSGGSTYSTFGLYANRNAIISPKTELNIGIRYNHTVADSKLLESSLYTLPYDEITFNEGALTGSISVLYKPTSTWKISGGVSSGFKSPNVDDYGKIFEKDGFVVVPNDDLTSEYVYSGDVTLEKSLLENNLKISATPFYTYLTDAIVRRDTVVNGSDQFLFEGELATVQTNKNAAEAHIYGISTKARYLFSEHWLAMATFNYTYGQDLTDDVPLSHISPMFGKVSIEYQKGRFTAEGFMNYAAKKDLDRYGPGSTDNLIEATEDGTPAWQTFNVRTSTQLSKTVIMQFAVENILDTHYKTFASGLSAPGRNFILSLKTFF